MSASDLANLCERAMAECRSERCPCARHKERRHFFCRRCTNALPKHIRAGLNMPLELGGAQAWSECLVWLEKEGFLRKGKSDGLFGGG